MTDSFNRAARRQASPSVPLSLTTGWKRWFALFCVLLLGAASTAQAAHTHGVSGTASHQTWGSPAGASDSPSGDEHCPLCVAMHSVLPAALPAVPGPTPLVLLVAPSSEERDVATDWHFARFSRPPPIAL